MIQPYGVRHLEGEHSERQDRERSVSFASLGRGLVKLRSCDRASKASADTGNDATKGASYVSAGFSRLLMSRQGWNELRFRLPQGRL